MTKLAVSKFWRRADESQQQVLIDEFTTLLLNTYTGALTEYSGESITFSPFKPDSREDRAVVSSTFSQSAGDDVPVVYKLRDKNGWSIYDIEVNDISLVTSYRAAFSSEIEKGGIVAEIPGMAKEDIALVVHHDRIRLSGHKQVDYGKEASVHRQERRHGEFDRTFSVPFNVDAAQVSARHQLGILTIFLPRAESDKPHAVKIQN